MTARKTSKKTAPKAAAGGGSKAAKATKKKGKKAPARKKAAATTPKAAKKAAAPARKPDPPKPAAKPAAKPPAKPDQKASASGPSALDVNMGHVFALRPRVPTSFRQADFLAARQRLGDERYESLPAAARAVVEKALELTHEKGSRRGRKRER